MDAPRPDPPDAPLRAADWAARYADGDTPWDKGAAHPELERRIELGQLSPTGAGRALVPGCGRGHDAAALAEAGWSVTALDVVDALLPACRAAIEAAGGEVVIADALAYGDGEPARFELFFEHTFLCAIHPSERPQWAALVERSLVPGGRLAHVVFPADKPSDQGGPPHGTHPEQVRALLGEAFEEQLLEPAERRARDTWEELWGIFRKP
jgi:SAM-dependent methyltransferase